MEQFIGIDLGTTNTKAVLVDAAGREKVSASLRTPVRILNSASQAEYDPDAVLSAVIELLRMIVSRAEEPGAIRAICISSMGETGVPIDAEGAWTYPAIAWYDTRAARQRELWARQAYFAEWYSRTGLPLSSSYGLMKLSWLKDQEPDVFRKTSSWLPIGDYINYRLSGTMATDYTQAWRTMAFDVIKLRWIQELLSESNLGSQFHLPEVRPCGHLVGTVTREVTSATGLPTECMVVLGGMDAACGMVAAGAILPGTVCDVVGTSEMIIMTLEKPVISPAAFQASLDVGPHAYPGRSLCFGSILSAGAALEWFAKLVNSHVTEDDLDETLSTLTREAGPYLTQRGHRNTLVLPHFAGSRSPYSDPDTRASIMGISLSTTRGELFYALIESLCLEGRLVLDTLTRVFSHTPSDYIVSGGVTENPLWRSIKAGVLGRTLKISLTRSLPAYGAAILAAWGAGTYPSVDQAVKSMQPPHREEREEPELTQSFASYYESHYRDLYSKVKSSGIG